MGISPRTIDPLTERSTNQTYSHTLDPPDDPSIDSSYEPSTTDTDSEAVTIQITSQARPIGEAEIFVGIVAAEALLYRNEYPQQASMPLGGIRITFTAGLRHAIDLDPLTGKKVTWGTLGNVLRQLSYVVYRMRISKEFVFVAKVGGVGVVRGVVHDLSGHANLTTPSSARLAAS